MLSTLETCKVAISLRNEVLCRGNKQRIISDSISSVAKFYVKFCQF